MAESIQLTNLQLQDDILKNLLLGLQKQSQFYVLKINETGEINEERKNYEKELSDINKVLTELSSKALSYTVQELDNLRTQFNDKLTQLNSVISDLEINTLKIEFNSLTPEQKTFLKGEQGPRGEKGLNPYEFAFMFGFVGTESDYLSSLKGADGKNGLDGKDGINGADGKNGLDGKDGINGVDGKNGLDGKDGINGVDGKNGLDGKDGINGVDGKNGLDGKDGINGADGQSLTFDMLTAEQKQSFIDSFLVTTQMQDILKRLSDLENGIPVTNLPFLNKEVQITEVENSGLTYYIKTNYQIKENDIISMTATFPNYDFLIQYKALSVGASFEFELLIDPYIDNYYSLSTELLPLTDGTLVIIPYISNNEGAPFLTDYVFGVSIEEVTQSIEPLDFTISNDSSITDTWV